MTAPGEAVPPLRHYCRSPAPGSARARRPAARIAPPRSVVTRGRILSSAVEPLAKNAAVSGSRRMLNGSGMAVTPALKTSKATASSAHNGQPCWRLRANAVVDLPTPETAHKATTPLLAAFCLDLPRSAPWPLGRTNAEQPCSSSFDLYHMVAAPIANVRPPVRGVPEGHRLPRRSTSSSFDRRGDDHGSWRRRFLLGQHRGEPLVLGRVRLHVKVDL